MLGFLLPHCSLTIHYFKGYWLSRDAHDGRLGNTSIFLVAHLESTWYVRRPAICSFPLHFILRGPIIFHPTFPSQCSFFRISPVRFRGFAKAYLGEIWENLELFSPYKPWSKRSIVPTNLRSKITFSTLLFPIKKCIFAFQKSLRSGQIMCCFSIVHRPQSLSNHYS